MVLLDTGCLCCTVRGDLVQTLTDLYTKRASGAVPPFGHVIIETTGLADPVPVLQTIVADENLRSVYRLHDVVTLVDVLHGESQLNRNVESVKQAAVADALLLTKTDLAAPQAVHALRRRLERLNPGATLHEVIRGKIEPAVFLRGSLYDPGTKSPDVERWLNAAAHADAAHGQSHPGREPPRPAHPRIRRLSRNSGTSSARSRRGTSPTSLPSTVTRWPISRACNRSRTSTSS
jgi:G3E family GTPase